MNDALPSVNSTWAKLFVSNKYPIPYICLFPSQFVLRIIMDLMNILNYFSFTKKINIKSKISLFSQLFGEPISCDAGTVSDDD